MKASETVSSSTRRLAASSTAEPGSSTKQQTHPATFAKVLDGRKQPVRGLWVRNGRFYAQLRVENAITGIKKTRRVPLVDKDSNPVQTVPQAVAEMRRLQTQRTDNALPTLERTPRFADYAKRYFEFIDSGQKAPGTVTREKPILARWTEEIGSLRLDQIKRVHVNRFIGSRLKETVSPRTINLDIIVLRVVLKRALQDGIIQRLPTEGLRPLKTCTPKRPLFTTADLDKLCAAAFETKIDKAGEQVAVTKNAQEFSEYVRLMAYCGARRNEALALRWNDVDFEQEQLTIGATGNTKNHSARTVDFNPKLKEHLADMQKRRAPDSEWIFPSPQRGDKDIHAQSFRESMELARTRARLPHVGFHDCRHHFISMAVMSGVDFMTIANWVGHRDGGILIGKVYGHLANEHRKAMAGKMNFGPAIVKQAAV